MLTPKNCHSGLEARSRFFGLEPVDVMLLFPGLYVCVVFLELPLLGLAITVASAVAIRLLKWGRLPGYTTALAMYVLLESHNSALGYDDAPPYPAEARR